MDGSRFTMATMGRSLRAQLVIMARDLYHDVDMVNSHPTLLTQLFERHGIANEKVTSYSARGALAGGGRPAVAGLTLRVRRLQRDERASEGALFDAGFRRQLGRMGGCTCCAGYDERAEICGGTADRTAARDAPATAAARGR